MGLETPVGAAVHTGGGESGEAQLVLAGGDVLGDLLQIREALDVLDGVARLLQQGLVDDQTVGLDHVADAGNGVAILQGEAVAGQLTVHLRILQIVAVILPAGQTHGAVHLEQSGGVGLGDLGGQLLLVGAGGGGQDGDGHAGLLGVRLGQILPCLILLRLKVQIIDLAGGGGGTVALGVGIALLLAAGDQRQSHDESQKHCNKLLHTINSFFDFIFTSLDVKNYLHWATERPWRRVVGSTSQAWAPLCCTMSTNISALRRPISAMGWQRVVRGGSM